MQKKLVATSVALGCLGLACMAAGAIALVAYGITSHGSVFSRGGSEPPTAAIVGGKPVGLFFMTRYWSFTGTLEKAAWYFAKDGRVYQNLEHGFSDDDLARHRGPHGTFSVDGDTMEVRWSDGKTTKSAIERDGDAFTWDMGIFTPVQPFDDGDRLAGAWEGGESLSHGGSAVAVSKTLELRADGTFTWDSISFLASEGNESRLSAGAEGGTSGKWELDGYSLTLTDTKGNQVRGIAFPYDDEKTPENPDHFFFAGTMYRRAV